MHANMNVTSYLSLANDSNSEETYGWNSAGTTANWSPLVTLSGLRWSNYVTAVVQWIIFFVGTVGNLIVLVVLVWRRSGSQVGTQLFIGSLAVSDIGMMLSTVWVEAIDALQNVWLFGVVFCKIHYLGQWLTMNCSIWTLAALSTDRCAIYFSSCHVPSSSRHDEHIFFDSCFWLFQTSLEVCFTLSITSNDGSEISIQECRAVAGR